MEQTSGSGPTLVVLAAGIGRRFGGAKQLEAVGPAGATLMEYSIFDAVRAGFDGVVFVIRPGMEATVREHVGRLIEKRIAVAYICQQLAPLPNGLALLATRTKPWGTGHAVLSAAPAVRGPFAVINADDYYGPSSFTALADFLRGAQDRDHATYAMVAFRLRDTLPQAGSVSRAVCQVSPDHWLTAITEITSIERHGADARYEHETGQQRTISGDALVSMNMWGFTPHVFEDLRSGFQQFLRDHHDDPNAESFLPSLVHDLIRSRHARVKVLSSDESWCGLTRSQDLPQATQIIRDRIACGDYPEDLWS